MAIVFGFGLLVAAAVIGFVSFPLLIESPNRRSARVPSGADLDDLLAEKDATYAAIKELEFDHDTGNLSDSDFEELREQQKGHAIGLLKRIESAEENMSRAERRSDTRRVERPKAQTSARAAVAKTGPRSDQQTARRYCTKCGKQYQPGDRFCGGCGAELS
ncbi:MAG: zinc ribbon domain-containing protein [Chloroflexi bacterium]|nr:zinc ribbon domain-containing protein [Chloroflexota bacterium]